MQAAPHGGQRVWNLVKQQEAIANSEAKEVSQLVMKQVKPVQVFPATGGCTPILPWRA